MIFGLVVLFEAGYTIWTVGLTTLSGLRILAGVLIVGPALWQAIDSEMDIGETETGWWTYAMIVGTIIYITGAVIGSLF